MKNSRELVRLEPVSLMIKKSRLRWSGCVERKDVIIIIQTFVRRTLSASELNLRRLQSLGGEDG